MSSKILLLSLLVVTLLGISVEGGHHHNSNGWGWDEYSHPKYKFSYGVNDKHTWDQKHASEWRDGDKVGGQYSLKEPDGTWRTVTYWADKGGFRANVHRTGWSSHPHHHGHKGHHYGHH